VKPGISSEKLLEAIDELEWWRALSRGGKMAG
jgi:hypothetical protein